MNSSNAANNQQPPSQAAWLATVGHVVSVKLILVIVLTALAGTLLICWSFGRSENSLWYFILLEGGKALLITAVISGGAKWYITNKAVKELETLKGKAIRHEYSSALDGLKDEVLEQTEKMTKMAASLEALHQAGIARVYPNRQQAAGDIRKALCSANVDKIQLIGISLNDFLRDEQPALHSAWKTIEEYVKTGRPPTGVKHMDIQILLINPNCKGAFLRADSESKEDAPSRLFFEVDSAMRQINELRTKMPGGSEVSLEVKLYENAPILYFVSTPSVTFIQQYHFRPTHSAGTDIPVFMFPRTVASDPAERGIVREFDHHFTWLWENGSVPLDDCKNAHCYGVDEGIRTAGIRNIYYDQPKSKRRIRYLLKDPNNQTIWLKGISLHAFFQTDDLQDALMQACTRADVKLLLIDPDGEQALFRSFREYRLEHPEATLDTFQKQARIEQKLYRDTQESIAKIKRMLEDLSKSGANHNLRAALFRSAPEAFVLITDEVALVEQYHYGKIAAMNDKEMAVKYRPNRILGGDFPVLEYGKIRGLPIQDESDVSRRAVMDPYRILRDHFTYVWDVCSKEIVSHPQELET